MTQSSPPIDRHPNPNTAQVSGRNGKAIASLVLGLLSIVGACFTGVPGLIFGIKGLGAAKKSGGKGIAVAGIVLSSLGILWTVGLLIALMLPAVAQVRAAAQRTQALNALRQQALAIHMYESKHSSFPAHDNGGLSWRVHILPFLGEEELYSRFKLDEPWDSPHNITLFQEMPQVFSCSGLELPAGMTVYQVPYTDVQTNPTPEEFAMFDNSGDALTFGGISDGASNTIMILEVDPAAAVEWTKPADWKFDPANPVHDLGSLRSGEFICARGDCSDFTVSTDMAPENFKAMITRQGGEVVGY